MADVVATFNRVVESTTLGKFTLDKLQGVVDALQPLETINCPGLGRGASLGFRFDDVYVDVGNR